MSLNGEKKPTFISNIFSLIFWYILSTITSYGAGNGSDEIFGRYTFPGIFIGATISSIAGLVVFIYGIKEASQQNNNFIKNGLIFLAIFQIIGIFLIVFLAGVATTRYIAYTPTQSAIQSPIQYLPTITPFIPTPTTAPPTFAQRPCLSWKAVTRSHLDTYLCVYGAIYTYGPYSDQWTYVQFSPAPDALRVMDFNFYYYTPLSPGGCLLVYGKIRDYGPHLIITPDKNTPGSVKTGPANFCPP